MSQREKGKSDHYAELGGDQSYERSCPLCGQVVNSNYLTQHMRSDDCRGGDPLDD